MAPIMNKNPMNDVMGPTIMRRVPNMSGLNSVPDGFPVMSKNPMIISSIATAIRMKFILESPNFLFSIFILNILHVHDLYAINFYPFDILLCDMPPPIDAYVF